MDPKIQQIQLCQCCLTEKRTMKNMLTATYQTILLSDILRTTFGMDLKDEQPTANSKCICDACEVNLKLSFEFREQCYKSQEILKERQRMLLIVKNEPISDDLPLIFYTSNALNYTKNLTQDFIETNTEQCELESIIKIEDTPTTKTLEEARTLPKPIDNQLESENGVHSDEKTQLDNGNETIKSLEATDTAVQATEQEESLILTDDSLDLSEEEYQDDSDDDVAPKTVADNSNATLEDSTGRYMCYRCDEYFTSYPTYSSHRDNHDKYMSRVRHLPINRTCYVCKEKVTSYRKHLVEKHPDFKPNECLQCDMKFSSQVVLRDHMVTKHSKNRKYKCRGCKTTFTRRSTLYNHLTLFKHKKRQYQCIRCGLSFRFFSNLNEHHHKKHMNQKHNKHVLPCYACKRVFSLKRLLLAHNCNPIVKKKKYADPALAHVCPFCDQLFGNADELLCHKMSMCDSGLSCNIEGCDGQTFTSNRKAQSIRKCVRTLKPNVAAHSDDTSAGRVAMTNSEAEIKSNEPQENHPGRYMCYTCDAFLSTFSAYKTHHRGCNHSQSRIRNSQICRACYLCKKNVIGYVNHLAEQHPDFKPNECLQCDMKTQIQRQLCDHLPSHFKQKLYKCEGCKSNFATKPALRAHIRRYLHAEDKYQCILCGLSFKLFANLDDHCHNDHKMEAHKHFYPCYDCKRVYGGHKHLTGHKCSPIVEKATNTNAVLPHKCPFCDQRFDNADELLCHQISLCVSRFRCIVEGCGKILTSQHALNLHILEKHGAIKRCTQCDFSTKKYYLLMIHNRQKHNPNSSLYLNNHTDSDNDNQLQHMGWIQFYECDLCSAKFRLKQAIQKHMVKHMSPESLHACSICDEKFVTAEQVETHEENHKKSIPKKTHHCDLCSKSFSKRSSLNEHQKRQHENNYYQCCYCPRIFKARTELNYHLFEHRGFSPFNCPKCPSKFVKQHL